MSIIFLSGESKPISHVQQYLVAFVSQVIYIAVNSAKQDVKIEAMTNEPCYF